MQIQIIATQVETKASANGRSYNILEVTFKNLTFNKTESKKLMSFGANKDAYDALKDAGMNSTWEISVVKNAQGYNDWVKATPTAPGAAPSTSPAAAGKPTTTTKSSYETPEERAQRQVYIVRQSSIANAVSILGAGAKAPLKVDEVLATAKQLEQYVFDTQGAAELFEDVPDLDTPQVI